MQVKDLMTPGAVSVEPNSSAAMAARLLSRHNLGALPVCTGDGKLQGMITDRDIVLRCVAAEESPSHLPVGDIMTRGCATISPAESCSAAAQLMARWQVRRLPVVDGGRLVGMLTLADLARSQRFDMEAAAALSEISDNILRPQRNGVRGPGKVAKPRVDSRKFP